MVVILKKIIKSIALINAVIEFTSSNSVLPILGAQDWIIN
jgi:hypothetical protein